MHNVLGQNSHVHVNVHVPYGCRLSATLRVSRRPINNKAWLPQSTTEWTNSDIMEELPEDNQAPNLAVQMNKFPYKARRTLLDVLARARSLRAFCKFRIVSISFWFPYLGTRIWWWGSCGCCTASPSRSSSSLPSPLCVAGFIVSAGLPSLVLLLPSEVVLEEAPAAAAVVTSRIGNDDNDDEEEKYRLLLSCCFCSLKMILLLLMLLLVQ